MQTQFRRAFRSTLIVAALGFSAAAFAQDQPAGVPSMPASFSQEAADTRAVKPVESASSVFVFEKKEHDWGKITEGESVEMKFPFKNTSDRTINIKAINTSCGCTSASDNPRVIAPGQATELKVIFNSTGKPGKSSKTVSVVTDETEAGGLYQLTIKGEVVQTLFSSEPVINLGELSAGEGGKHTFKIISMSEPTATIESVSLGDERIKATVGALEDYTHKDGRTGKAYPIELSIPSDYPPASQIRTVVTVNTSEAKRGPLNISVNGSVVGNFVISPARVLLGRVAPGEQKEQKLTLRSKADEPYEVTLTPRSTTTNFTIREVPATSPNLRQWAISFTAPTAPGNFTETFDLKAKSATRDETISVPVSAHVRPATGDGVATNANTVKATAMKNRTLPGAVAPPGAPENRPVQQNRTEQATPDPVPATP